MPLEYSKVILVDTRKSESWSPIQAVMFYYGPNDQVCSAANHEDYWEAEYALQRLVRSGVKCFMGQANA